MNSIFSQDSLTRFSPHLWKWKGVAGTSHNPLYVALSRKGIISQDRTVDFFFLLLVSSSTGGSFTILEADEGRDEAGEGTVSSRTSISCSTNFNFACLLANFSVEWRKVLTPGMHIDTKFPIKLFWPNTRVQNQLVNNN